MHSGSGEVGFAHFVSQPVDLYNINWARRKIELKHLSASVTENDGLSDSERVVEIAKGVELPVFLFDGDEELLDTCSQNRPSAEARQVKQSQCEPSRVNSSRLTKIRIGLPRYHQHRSYTLMDWTDSVMNLVVISKTS